MSVDLEESRQNITELVVDLLEKELQIAPILLTTPMAELDIESLSLDEVLMRVEDVTGKSLSLHHEFELAPAATIGDLVAAIQNRLDNGEGSR